MIKTVDQRHSKEPLVFERFDHALGDGDRAVLADRAEVMLHAPAAQQLFERLAAKRRILVGDEVAGWAVTLECGLECATVQPAFGPSNGHAATTLRE